MNFYNAMEMKETIGYLIHGDKVKIWKRVLRNELGCFYQGNYFVVKGTETIYFIPLVIINKDETSLMLNLFVTTDHLNLDLIKSA